MSPATQSSSAARRLVPHSALPQSRVPSSVVRRVEAEVAVRAFSRHASAGRPVQKAVLDQKRLVDVFDGVLLFADRGGDAPDADGTAAELVDDRTQQLAVDLVESVLVDFEHLQGRTRDVERDAAVRANLRVVANAPQQA